MHSTEFRESRPAGLAAERILCLPAFQTTQGSAATRASGRFARRLPRSEKNAWGKYQRVMKRRLAARRRSEHEATERSRVPSAIASRLDDTIGDGKRKFELLLQALLPEVFS